MSDYPMLISNKLHSFRNFRAQIYQDHTNILEEFLFRKTLDRKQTLF